MTSWTYHRQGWCALAAWSGWSVASLGWSLHPAYTKAELGTEIAWRMATATIFYVAARSAASFRTLTVAAVACALATITGLFSRSQRDT